MKFSSIGLDKRALEDSRDEPMANYMLVLDETIIVTSTDRGLITTFNRNDKIRMTNTHKTFELVNN